ncbi:hypothetical protein KBY97_04965 [Synechococcus sp. ATX 2A4]|nr:hypothetical protein [Synechococcus sp. ATX 2A4]
MAWLSLRWVHRHGVEALPPLMQELTAGDASLKGWWHDHLHATAAPGTAPDTTPAAAGEAAVAAAEQTAAAPELVAQGFSFAAITLDGVQLEIEGSSPELTHSFDQATGPEHEISPEESAGADAAVTLAATEDTGPPIGVDAAAPADPAAGPSTIGEAPVEFLGEPFAFDPWLEAPAAATLTAEGIAVDLLAADPVGEEAALEGVAPKTGRPESVSPAVVAAEDLPAEAASSAPPEPGDGALDGFVQAPLPFLELSLDPVPAVPPLIPARPSAGRMFNFGAEPAEPSPQPAKPRSDEPSATSPSGDPQAADGEVELAATDPQADLTAASPAEPNPHPAEAAEVAQAPIWRGPLARVKSLVRVCLEEVVSTFHNSDDGSDDDDSGTASTSDSASASGPGQASSSFRPGGTAQARGTVGGSDSASGSDPAAEQLSALEPELPARPPRLSATEIAPALTPQGRTLPLRERAAGAVAGGRPAPAPAHPGLASLRSWLPDDTSPADTHSS